MSSFALNLDLSLYFEDLRKYASVYVDSTKYKEVGDVENHIKTVFKLDDNICLTNKKFLIPRSESIHILQQYDLLKVQKCDFYDYQIHKTKGSNPFDNPALNLVQSDRTIDLSCRPKQRLKINNSQNRCILESPSTLLENGRFKYTIQLPTTASDKVSDQISEIQTKQKSKTKKKKHAIQKDEEEVNGDETGTNILDMSFNKLKRKYKDDNLLAEEKQQITSNTPLNYVNKSEPNQECSNEYKRKSKKRKKHLEVEEVDLATSCWETLVADKENDKKRKTKTKNLDKEDIEGMARDLTSTLSNYEVEDGENNLNMCFYEKSLVRKKQKNGKKLRDIDDKHSVQSANVENNDGSPKPGINCIKTGISDIFPRNGNCKEVYNAEVNADRILNRMDIESSSFNKMLVDQPAELNSSKIVSDTQNKNDYDEINGKLSCSEDESLKDQNSFKTVVKRKRVRKHNKKKKREKQEYLSAVGPLLNRMITLPEKETASTSSEMSKHVFFTDDDFIEDMKIPGTPSNRSPSILKDNSDQNENLSQDNVILDASRTIEKKGLQDLLTLSSGTCKPLIFHRKMQSAIPGKNHSSSNPCIEKSHQNKSPNHDSNCVKESSEGLNCTSEEVKFNNNDSIVEVDLKSNNKTSSNTSDSKESKPDLKSIILTEYPIIDKVVAEDIILFKVLKLSESLEPCCSATVLGKVKDVEEFPEKISVHVMDFLGSCKHNVPSLFIFYSHQPKVIYTLTTSGPRRPACQLKSHSFTKLCMIKILN